MYSLLWVIGMPTLVTKRSRESAEHIDWEIEMRLALFLVPPPIHNIIEFSKLFSLRMICPKYDNCCFSINASNGLVAFVSSITDLLVRLAVHGIRSSLLQHHNSKLSILLLSAFLIVHDSQPYSTIGKTNAFTILHFSAVRASLLAIHL